VGIKVGDVITDVDQHKVVDTQDFVATVSRLHAGDSVSIRLTREGGIRTIPLAVKMRPFESSPDARTLYEAVTVDGNLRRVIVTVPKSEGKHPAVLYMTGIGCASQESIDLASTEAKLLYGLTGAGFVTMRVEKSGVGDSQGLPCMNASVDMQAEVRGYTAGLGALKQYPFVDSNHIFIIGFSVGGVEAPLVAEQVPVQGLVVINTVAKPFLEYLIDTRRRQNMLQHIPYDEMERRLRLNEQCNHRLLIERQPPDQLLKDLPGCKDFIEYPAPYSYMQQWAVLNPAEEWRRVDVPVLVVYGDSDFVSTIADDHYLADLIGSFHPGNATLREIPGMDHYLAKAPSMEESMKRAAGILGEFEPAVLNAVREWLDQHARKTF
jgi:pimeloyl-ACP methyl ester carboxylesterase